MADRYYVGGGAAWNGIADTKWATTSGGAGGEPVPTIADDVFFDANSGGANVSIRQQQSAKSINCTGFGGGLTGSGSLTIAGSFTLNPAMQYQRFGQTTFTGTGTLTTAGKSFSGGITINGVGIILTLGDALLSSSSVTLTQGTFDAANYNVSVYGLSSNNANVRTLTMGSGLWTLSGASQDVWNTSTTTNLTFNKDTADILLTSTAVNTRNFFGGGLSFNKLTIGGAAGASSVLIISGANSFTELASIKTVAHTVRFSADQGTINTWSITGTSGNVVTLDSSVAGTRRTFSLTNVTSGIDFLNVTDIGVNETDRFYVGANSIDGGNNLNVIFTAPPALTATGNFFMLFS